MVHKPLSPFRYVCMHVHASLWMTAHSPFWTLHLDVTMDMQEMQHGLRKYNIIKEGDTKNRSDPCNILPYLVIHSKHPVHSVSEQDIVNYHYTKHADSYVQWLNYFTRATSGLYRDYTYIPVPKHPHYKSMNILCLQKNSQALGMDCVSFP